MFHSTTIEISRSAYSNNIEHIKKMSGGSQLCVVLKGNAYGHGLNQMVELAMLNHIKNFAVFSADEAYKVKSICSDKSRMLIMGMIPDEAISWAIENQVAFYIFNLDRLYKAIEISRKMNRKAKVHLEVETGMNRTGLNLREYNRARNLILKNKDNIEFAGLCTHLAGAESISNYIRIQNQITRFNHFIHLNDHINPKPACIHAACSAAIIRYPETCLDMVRTGILQYGFFPSPEIFIEYTKMTNNFDNPLTRIIRWKSKVMDVKMVKKNSYIGYGSSYLSAHNMKIAAIPVGYAHGFNRSLSNQGHALIQGKRHSVIGMVNMNMLLADVTDTPNVSIGDEVVLIGRQGEAEISVASFCEMSNQVDYELLTRLDNNIPRILVD